MRKQLHNRDELIACLRENPTQRLVGYVGVVYPDDTRAILEFPRGRDLGAISPCRIIAHVAEGSDAEKLLDEVYSVEVDAPKDGALACESSDRPIRYGPGCSEWCLPEHPELHESTSGGA